MVLNQPSTDPQAKLPKRQRILRYLVSSFFAKEGDLVYFKNVPRKKRVEWTVIGVETNPHKTTWTKKGNRPNFVHLRRKDNPKMTVWTCSDQLAPAGFTDEKADSSGA